MTDLQNLKLWAILAGVAVPCAIAFAQHQLAKNSLFNWAQSLGIHITSYERRYIRCGPFVAGRGRFVFRIHATNFLGEPCTGWALTGHWIIGALAGDVEAVWDEPSQPAGIA